MSCMLALHFLWADVTNLLWYFGIGLTIFLNTFLLLAGHYQLIIDYNMKPFLVYLYKWGPWADSSPKALHTITLWLWNLHIFDHSYSSWTQALDPFLCSGQQLKSLFSSVSFSWAACSLPYPCVVWGAAKNFGRVIILRIWGTHSLSGSLSFWFPPFIFKLL